MKVIERIESTRTKHVYNVELTDEECNWPNARVITAVDRRGNLTPEQWRLIESGEVHPGNFGGLVRPSKKFGLFEVTVYVD